MCFSFFELVFWMLPTQWETLEWDPQNPMLYTRLKLGIDISRACVKQVLNTCICLLGYQCLIFTLPYPYLTITLSLPYSTLPLP